MIRVSAAAAMVLAAGITPTLLGQLPPQAATRSSSGTGSQWIEEVQEGYRDRVAAVLSQPSLVVPPLSDTFRGSLDTYEFLLFRPDLVARLWHVVGYSNTRVTAGPDGWFHASDTLGNRGRWRYVYRGRTLAVAYGEGRFLSPLRTTAFPFRVVVVWRYTDAVYRGRSYVTHQASAAFRLEQPAQHRLLLAIRPFAQPLARRRLHEAMLSLSIPVQLAERDPERYRLWLQQAVAREPVAEASPRPSSPGPRE